MIDVVNLILIDSLKTIGGFLPSLFAGLLILVVGLLIGSIFKHFLVTVFNFVKIDDLVSKSKILPKGQVKIWVEVLGEVLKWVVFVMFLIPTLEIWGLQKATDVLNQFLLYLPNILVAVVIAFVGMISANLLYDVVKHSVKTLGASSANTLSTFARWMVIFLTTLIVLNQLGVAQDLVKILFTGIVAMVALAGGLAFGLGGKDVAQKILEDLKKKLEG